MTIEFIVSVIVAITFGVWIAFYRPKPRSVKFKHVMVSLARSRQRFRIPCFTGSPNR